MGRLVVPLLIGTLGAAVLVSLGLWQVQRLAWKEAVLGEIEARIAADPVPLPQTPDPEADRYRPVAVTGTISGDDLRVLISAKGVGPAYRIIAPLTLEDGRRVMVDRGYVPDAQKNTPRPGGQASITGNLHWPDEIDGFTPDNDVANNIWFARDVPVMAEALGTEPVLIIARQTSESDPVVTPLPVDTSGIPNDHLQYAVTWFGLAAVWILMTGLWVRRIVRGTG
ncbi:MAG: SURF1 family protein [Pseudomonadota bacterium]